MPWISTRNPPPDFSDQVYNGMDSLLTLEIFDAIAGSSEIPPVYNFERALQGPYLEIMLRGFKVDQFRRRVRIEELTKKVERLEWMLNRYSQAIWDRDLNANSPLQLKNFFYKTLGLPEVTVYAQGQRKVSTNREALEKLDLNFIARPCVAAILAIRDLKKKISVLSTEIDGDGRWRSSYNIAGTETGRMSSSSSAFGTGSNSQNVTEDLRDIFIADDDHYLIVIDLEQAESREVGFICGVLFDDWSYLDACEGGDLHTTTCKMIWPQLPWPGNPEGDKELAEQKFYRDFSYRDMSKRGGHGCLTSDHEVLTPRGWVNITEKPSTILTWDPDGLSSFAPVSQWTDFIHSGPVITWEGRFLSISMTPDHRFAYKNHPSSDVFVRRAEQGVGKWLPLGEGFTGGKKEVPAELFAYICAYSISFTKGKYILFPQTKFTMEKIIELIPANYQWEKVQDTIHIECAENAFFGPDMFEWTRLCLLKFLLTYKKLRGKTNGNAFCFHSTKEETLSWIQTIHRVMGFGGTLNPNGKYSFRLTFNNYRWISRDTLTQTTEERTCRMLCPTVPSSFFYIRRNGKISVTGNSNYLGTPPTMARHLKVPVEIMAAFQPAYFSAFPCIPKWHIWTNEQLQQHASLTTSFGFTRTFFGRTNDPKTLREAVAFSPQSSTAHRTNLALLRMWEEMPRGAHLLGMYHDAVAIQAHNSIPKEELVPQLLSIIDDIVITYNGRKFSVPGEAKTGWNWGKAKEGNPDGLIKWKKDQRTARTNIFQTLL